MLAHHAIELCRGELAALKVVAGQQLSIDNRLGDESGFIER